MTAPKVNRKAFLLEELSESLIDSSLKRAAALTDFQQRFYFETAIQRARLREQISGALLSAAIPFQFSEWSRIVAAKYNSDPLSTLGSFRSPIGGRFNIGSQDPVTFPGFSALYCAENSLVAHAERFGQSPNDTFTPEQLGLIKEPFSNFILSGSLRSVIDLRETGGLRDYVKVIRKVKLSKSLAAEARKFKMLLVQSEFELKTVLLHPNWRLVSNIFNIPSSSQIFGLQCLTAGVEGIIYSSAKTKGSNLVVFPKSLANSDSRVFLEGELSSEVINREMNAETWPRYWHSGL